jgi:hypothetical protein
MSAATANRTVGKAEVDEEIRHVHDLLFLRDVFTRLGATQDELAEYDAAIAAARGRLAEVARAASSPFAAAA